MATYNTKDKLVFQFILVYFNVSTLRMAFTFPITCELLGERQNTLPLAVQ